MSNEQMSLGDILSDAPNPEPSPDKVVEAEGVTKPDPVEKAISRKTAHRDQEQEAQGRVRDPATGQYAPKEVKEEPKPTEAAPVPEAPKPEVKAPVQEFTEKEKAFLRAAKEERQKRQELERRLAAMEAKPAPTTSTEAPKTFWDDPEAALAAHTAQVRAEATNARLGMAEFTARQKHPDFDEKVAKFAEILQQTPGLHAQWLAAPDPAEFAYSLAKNHMELQQVGSMEEMRAKIVRETTASVRAQVEAELKAKAEALTKEREAIPQSLSTARSVGGNANRTVWSGPTPLDSILGKG